MSVLDVLHEHGMSDSALLWGEPEGRKTAAPPLRETNCRSGNLGAFGSALLQLQEFDWNPAGKPVPARSNTPLAPSQHGYSAPCSRRDGKGDLRTVDRRKMPRRASKCLIVFCIWGEGPADGFLDGEWALQNTSYGGFVSDVSLTGVAFTTDQRISAGETLLMCLSNRQLGSRVKVAGTVLRVSVELDGEYRVVCTFNRPLGYPEYDSIGGSRMPENLV